MPTTEKAKKTAQTRYPADGDCADGDGVVECRHSALAGGVPVTVLDRLDGSSDVPYQILDRYDDIEPVPRLPS